MIQISIDKKQLKALYAGTECASSSKNETVNNDDDYSEQEDNKNLLEILLAYIKSNTGTVTFTLCRKIKETIFKILRRDLNE